MTGNGDVISNEERDLEQTESLPGSRPGPIWGFCKARENRNCRVRQSG
jgi:hypothetical protein